MTPIRDRSGWQTLDSVGFGDLSNQAPLLRPAKFVAYTGSTRLYWYSIYNVHYKTSKIVELNGRHAGLSLGQIQNLAHWSLNYASLPTVNAASDAPEMPQNRHIEGILLSKSAPDGCVDELADRRYFTASNSHPAVLRTR